MKHCLFATLAAATMMLAVFVGDAVAQENLPMGPSNYEQDFQMFAPFDLDLDNMVDDQWSGYFFEYNKLFWSYTGERITVGAQNTSETINFFDGVQNLVLTSEPGTEFAEVIYRVNPQDFVGNGAVPPPPAFGNSLRDVPPDAGFAYGNRYEFGYQDQGHGWQIGILDGPEQNQTNIFGFERNIDPTNGGLPPFIDPDYTGPTDIGPGGGTSAAPGDRAFGFGSVHMLFEMPPGYLLGFRDYVNSLADAILGTQAGPMLYVGNYGRVNEVAIDDVGIPFFRRADDINGNGIEGSEIILVVGPDGIIRAGILKDFDDLHKFNIYFDNVTVHNRTETDGVEAMWTHDLTNQHYMAKHKNNRLQLSWGARFLKLDDQFRVTANGSVLHDGFWDTRFQNQIVGPQVGFSWLNQRQRWRLQTDGRFMFGYNVADWDQNGLIGFGLIPGALNQPLYARPTAFASGLREQEFSPVGELRVSASYHFTSAFALKFGYTGTFAGNIRRAAPSVRYQLPDMGYVKTDGEELVVNGFDLGVEFVH